MRQITADTNVEEPSAAANLKEEASKGEAPKRGVVINGRRYLSAKEFGESLPTPKSGSSISRLCTHGRVKGAVKPANVWLIPANASVQGKGQRVEYGKHRGISVKEFARKHGRSPQRAYVLLKQGRIEGARRTPHGWDLDPNAPWPADDGF